MYKKTPNYRYKIVKKLRNQRFSFAEIGKKLGISKSMAFKIFKKGEYLKKAIKNPIKRPSEIGSISRTREKIRTRDNHSCQYCGIKWKEGTRRLDVHHLDENITGKVNTSSKGFSKYDRENHDKLITLCHKCHLGLHARMRNKLSTTVA